MTTRMVVAKPTGQDTTVGRRSRWAPRAGLLALLTTALVFAVGCGRKPDRPNLVLISIDTLRPDHLGCYGYDRPTSPTIDSLASTGVLFENATALSPWTLPSHVTLLSSTLPFTHGVVDDNCRIPEDVPLLAEVLRSHGYRCVGAVSSFYVGRTFGFERGFDRFEDFEAHMLGQVSEQHKILADSVTHLGLAWMLDSSEPFFLFLHYYDPHYNYVLPEPYRSRFYPDPDVPAVSYKSYRYYKTHPLPERKVRYILSQYDGAIAYVDENIRRVLRALSDRGVADRTVIVVTSDHGEEFFERGGWGHGGTLHREVLDVPLILADPRRTVPGVRIGEPVRLVDVVPTVLDVLGLPVPPGVQGVSLWPLVAGSPPSDWDPLLFSDTSRDKNNLASLTRGPLKLIADLGNDERWLYDLESDPGEDENVGDSDTSLVRVLFQETLAVGAGLIPGRVCVRWRTEGTAHTYAGTLRSIGAVVGVDYRGEPPDPVRVSADRHRLTFTADRPGEIRLAVVPVDASVVLNLTIDGEADPGRVFVGGDARQPDGLPLTFSGLAHSTDLLLPPPDRGGGFYVWRDPGDRSAAQPVELSEEAREHLRSLGYVH